MPSRIILIRHGLPAVAPDVDSREWGLAAGAAEAAQRLATMLSDDIGDTIWTSSERKAIETAEAIARIRDLRVAVDERFGEVRRPWTAGDYRAEALRYLSGDVPDGWEEPAAVVERFSAATRATGARTIVDHGLAMALYAGSVATIDVRELWAALTLPDAWLVDVHGATVTRICDAADRQM